MRYIYTVFIGIILLPNCRPGENQNNIDFSGKPEVPEIILQEHRSLLDTVDSLALLTDSTGRAALKLKEIMHHHFQEEENFALPALAVLPSLSNDHIPSEHKEIIRLVEKFREQQNHLIAEHQLITLFLTELVQISKLEKHRALDNFQHDIQKHAATEEVIYFPAAILVGDYLKLKTKESPHSKN